MKYFISTTARFFGAFCAFCVTLLAFSPAHAALVTLRFEAKIDRLSGLPFDSGIDFAAGDVITGQFTFEPADGVGNMSFESVQPFEFRFLVNGVELSTPSFEINAVNNSPIFDFPLASVIDSLRVGAGGLSPTASEQFPNIDAATSGFRMTLFGPQDSVAESGVPGEVEVWNKYDLRRQLSVSIRNGTGDVVGFQATVDDFAVVPEPTAGCIASVIFAGAIWVRRPIFF